LVVSLGRLGRVDLGDLDFFDDLVECLLLTDLQEQVKPVRILDFSTPGGAKIDFFAV